jgi:hypothetical protein
MTEIESDFKRAGHCEERSDAATQKVGWGSMLESRETSWFASLRSQ